MKTRSAGTTVMTMGMVTSARMTRKLAIEITTAAPWMVTIMAGTRVLARPNRMAIQKMRTATEKLEIMKDMTGAGRIWSTDATIHQPG